MNLDRSVHLVVLNWLRSEKSWIQIPDKPFPYAQDIFAVWTPILGSFMMKNKVLQVERVERGGSWNWNSPAPIVQIPLWTHRADS